MTDNQSDEWEGEYSDANEPSLTREAILNATPDELDVMVAHVMGWHKNDKTPLWYDKDDKIILESLTDGIHPSRDMTQVMTALRASPAKWWIIDRRLGPSIPPEEIVKVTLPPMWPIQAPCQMAGPTEEIAIERAILLATLASTLSEGEAKETESPPKRNRRMDDLLGPILKEQSHE